MQKAMIKRFHSNLFFVEDLEKTTEFYEKLGFAVEKSADAIRIKIGDFTLAFMDEEKVSISNEVGLEPKGSGVYTYVEVEDVDKYYEFVKNNGIYSNDPKTWPWGKREFVVKDPDGYKFVFYSAV